MLILNVYSILYHSSDIIGLHYAVICIEQPLRKEPVADDEEEPVARAHDTEKGVLVVDTQ